MTDPTTLTTDQVSAELLVETVERMATAVALLEPVAAVTDRRHHWASCHQVHTTCLATRIIATLTGEDPDA